jgi:multisubunit Na+/H+ antiporter MnhB subunit
MAFFLVMYSNDNVKEWIAIAGLICISVALLHAVILYIRPKFSKEFENGLDIFMALLLVVAILLIWGADIYYLSTNSPSFD